MTNSVLFLHIGYHKTGTTTLQKHIFPRLPATTFIPKLQAEEIAAAFLSSPCIWREEAVLPRGDGKSALVSEESISAHRLFYPPHLRRYRRDPFLLAAHLKEFQKAAINKGFHRVKVIMGVRRQDQYLASRYSNQGLPSIPSQADFEKQILEIVDRKSRYLTDGILLDYRLVRELIAGALGGDAVLVLPLEQLGADPGRYLAALGAFMEESIPQSHLRENIKNVRPDVWRFGAQLPFDRLVRVFGLPKRFWRRKIEIRLTPELKAKVLGAYRESNTRLADDIGIDLSQYGYY